jgi:hypothetical protein
MLKKSVQILSGLAIALSFAACSKSGSGTDEDSNHLFSANDITPPEILIFTPVAGQVFTNSSTINITGRITDDLGLYRGTIKIVNEATGNTVMSQSYEIHGLRLYNFSINQPVSVSAAADYTVTVSFEDHGANSATQSVVVKVNP